MTQIWYGMGIASVRNDGKKHNTTHVYVLLGICKKTNKQKKNKQVNENCMLN